VWNPDDLVAAGGNVDPVRWRAHIDELMSRIAGRFARVEPCRRARRFVLALLSSLPSKNCWTISEHAGDATPDGMQHLLARAVWDVDGVRDDLRGYLTYATAAGHAFIDRAVYLPRRWVDDPARCAAAGVADTVAFATKPALATHLLARVVDAGVGASWVADDEVYGADPGLRGELERRGVGYVLAIG
jgi:hypothetical protein